MLSIYRGTAFLNVELTLHEAAIWNIFEVVRKLCCVRHLRQRQKSPLFFMLIDVLLLLLPCVF